VRKHDDVKYLIATAFFLKSFFCNDVCIEALVSDDESHPNVQFLSSTLLLLEPRRAFLRRVSSRQGPVVSRYDDARNEYDHGKETGCPCEAPFIIFLSSILRRFLLLVFLGRRC